jgi:hypothetical protein
MPAPYDTKNGRLRVSSTSGGTFANIYGVTDAPYTEGSDSASRTKYLGGEWVKAGDPTLSGSFTAAYNDADTTGQNIIRTAKRAGTSVWFQWCPAGTATGAKVWQFEAYIDELSGDLNADNEWVMNSFSYTGVPSTWTEVTLA